VGQASREGGQAFDDQLGEGCGLHRHELVDPVADRAVVGDNPEELEAVVAGYQALCQELLEFVDPRNAG
jgi:hypothetical protein